MNGVVDWCANHGLEPIIVDNHSDYPPLLEYYRECPYRIIHLEENHGHRVVWKLGLQNRAEIKGRYIVTDPDLDLSGIPDDFLDVLNGGLNKYPYFKKCGFSLEINDLPDSTEAKFIRPIELKYWSVPLDHLYFNAMIDTTFALYENSVNRHIFNAIRTNRPYTAKHLSWYYTDFNLLPEDERYYYMTANEKSCSGKKRLLSNEGNHSTDIL